MSCIMCNGELALLGQLGRKLWLRCINCHTVQTEDGEIE